MILIVKEYSAASGAASGAFITDSAVSVSLIKISLIKIAHRYEQYLLRSENVAAFA